MWSIYRCIIAVAGMLLVGLGTSSGENFANMTSAQLQSYIAAKSDSVSIAQGVLQKKLHSEGAARTASAISDSITKISPTAKTVMGLIASTYAVDSVYVQLNIKNSALPKLALKTSDVQALILKAVNDTAVVARKDRALGVLRKLEEYAK